MMDGQRTLPMSTAEPLVLPRVLLASDQMVAAQAFAAALQGDYELLFETSGRQVLERCQEQLPDLILLAPGLADMPGLQLCHALKHDPLTRYVPVIFFSAVDDPVEEARCLQEGCVDFILTPVHAEVLRARVQTHLMLRQATKRILAFNMTLEMQVAQRTAEINASLEALHEFHSKLVDSEARATLSTIVASVSHELGAPIGNSRLTASMLADQTKHFNVLVDAGELKRSELGVFLKVLTEGTELMERSLSRATELLNNFKQVAVDQASDQRREFELGSFVQEVIASIMPSLQSKPHRLVVEISAGIMLHSLPGRLAQVLINLINNAYLHAFTDEMQGVVSITARQFDEQVRILIADNGVGMSTEQLARLYEPFFSTRIGNGGSGLGMAIVKNLVCRSLGGSLAVQSVEGEGTTFNLELPVHAPLDAH
jgi:signal transduction histidine kinase